MIEFELTDNGATGRIYWHKRRGEGSFSHPLRQLLISQLEIVYEYPKSLQRQGPDCERWSVLGLRGLADEQANDRYEFSRRVSQMDCGAGVPRTSNVRAVSLRAEREETLLRWLARQST